MAAICVPPRIFKKDDSKSQTTKNGKDSLEILKQMGFPENRALKALAATGDKGVQLASDWLLSHVNDLTLDDKVDREYVLYLCPVGGLQAELNAFWEKSQNLCGWNGAHASFPHITLCPFFKVEDKKLKVLNSAFSTLESKVKNLPSPLVLEFFSQQNFIGLFVGAPHYDIFKKVVQDFAAEVKKAGITMEPPKKQFHVTCAYQYAPENHETLCKLAKEIHLHCDTRWDIRLYSRDPKVGHCEVRKVLRPYQPKLMDELELVSGDYIVIDPNEVTKSTDTWYNGISWSTGIHGAFPSSFTKRTAETWIWTLHNSLPITFKDNAESTSSVQSEPVYAKVIKDKKHKVQTLFVMRHGERIDFCFGRDWTAQVFEDDGKYHPNNLNMPKTLMKRKSHLEYIRDSPLTEMGKYQARLTGAGFKDRNVNISHVFVSPALRCIETGQAFLEGYGNNSIKMCIEPSLFEYLGWYHPILPIWMKGDDLLKHGYSINTGYTPFLPVKDMNLDETVAECYSRSANFSRFVTKKFPPDSGSILLIGHACSLDVCTHQLCGHDAKSNAAFHQNLNQIPYCGLCMVQEDPSTRKWVLKEPPVPSLTHSANKAFDSKIIRPSQT